MENKEELVKFLNTKLVENHSVYIKCEILDDYLTEFYNQKIVDATIKKFNVTTEVKQNHNTIIRFEIFFENKKENIKSYAYVNWYEIGQFLRKYHYPKIGATIKIQRDGKEWEILC